MASEIVLHHRSMFILWGVPELMDVRRILRGVAKLPRPYVIVARVPQSVPFPGRDFQSAMESALSEVLEQCWSWHAIVEGTGITHALKRCIGTAVLLRASRGRKNLRGKCHIHAHAAELLEFAKSPDLRFEISELLRCAGSLGLLTRTLCGTPIPETSDAPASDIAEYCRFVEEQSSRVVDRVRANHESDPPAHHRPRTLFRKP